MTSLPTLYSRTSDGRVQTWTMQVEGDSYRTVTGYHPDGARVESAWKAAKPKNVGKKNATTAEEQAELEARAHWKKRTERGYHEDISKIDTATNGLDVMLAKDADTFIEKGKLNFREGLMVQTKLNGCLSPDTKITTNIGDIPIDEIVKKQIDCLVLSFNESIGKHEFKPIKHFMDNCQSKTEFYEIILENGQILCITGEHQIYMPILRCWRDAKDLSVGDILQIK